MALQKVEALWTKANTYVVFVERACVRSKQCKGKVKLQATYFPQGFDEYFFTRDNDIKTAPCNKCGNVAGLSNLMIKETLKRVKKQIKDEEVA